VRDLARRTRRRRQASSSGARRRTATRRSVRVDPEAVLRSVVNDIVSKLGLDVLGLEENDYLNILRPVVEAVVSSYSSRPSREAVISRIVNNPRPVYMYAAAYLLEKREYLNEEQLEFVIVNAPEIAARFVSRLYRGVVSAGRKDLVALLRGAWEKFGRPLPVTCPYCGFRSVTPDYYCIVCEREVNEKDIKESINFNELLKEYVEFYGYSGVRETLEKGYVVLRETLYPPSSEEVGEPGLRLYLSRKERELLRQLAKLHSSVERSESGDRRG